MKLVCIRGHHIWTPPLTQTSIVIDAGAHRGEFSAEIIRRFGCQCHLVEANPTLVATLNVPGAASITSAALGAQPGRAAFHMSENLEGSSLTESHSDTVLDVEVISLPLLMQRLGI